MNADVVVRILMAASGAGTLLTGYLLSKRGQQDTREQQLSANKLQTRINTVEELETVISHLKEERDRIAAEADRLRAHNDELSERQAQRCQHQLNSLIETLAALQTVVQDEIARAAALDDVRDAQDHLEQDHDIDDLPRY